MHTVLLGLTALMAVGAAGVRAESFDYDRKLPTDLREQGREERAGSLIRDVTFAGLGGKRTAAYLIEPPKGTKRSAAILYVHWYEPESPLSNRKQFLEEAVEMSRGGAVSLLVETMWSSPEWFAKRVRADDYANSVAQVKDLRRALDVLVSQSGIDPDRVAYVGHDFGGMYGSVLAGVEPRVKVWALQAFPPKASAWFLLGEKPSPEERKQIADRLAPIDPVRSIGKAAPRPVLLQFGRKDPYVSSGEAEELADAAGDPKRVLFYDAGHALNDAARVDRMNWLRETLHLKRTE